MTPERWAEIRAVVEAAVSVPAAERAAYLSEHVDDEEVRVEALRLLNLEGDAGDLFPVETWREQADAQEHASFTEQTLGSYRLLGELGRGGMGAVYLAERADGVYQQRVAIKVLQEQVFTPALVERFREERQILAGLKHAGIARLLDGGVTVDGRPYLVLEYVDGKPIDQYCDEAKLSLEERLRLFLQVAAAVQDAHQQLVLHLDLKPANILITPDGEPRLLDFGIARILPEGGAGARQAEETLRLLTPRYASPEQASGSVLGVASDVFSLTTLLYRILTGTLPYPLETATPLEAIRILCDTDPTPPGRVRPELRGDLETILLKGLRKEPERRYPTVAALADDVERHLTDKPVLAHPDSFGYRLKKFVTRHRVGVLATAAILLVLAGSVIAVVHSAVQSRRAEKLAEKRLQDERDLAHSYVFDLEPMLENIPGTVKVRAFILQHALKYLDAISGDIANDNELAEEVSRGYMGFGQVQADGVEPSMSDRAGAWKSMQHAYEIQQRLVDHDPDNLKRRGFLVVNLRLMSFLAAAEGDIERSEALSQKALAQAQPILAAGPLAPRYLTVSSVMWDLSNNRAGNGGSWNFGDPQAALPWLDRMHDLVLRYQKAGENDPKMKQGALQQLHRESMSRATVYRELDRNEEARAQYENALHEWSANPTHTLTETQSLRVIHYNYADFLLSVNEPKAAAAMAPPLPEAASHEAGADRSQMRDEADILGLLARIDLRNGRLSKSRAKMERSLSTYEALYREDPNEITSTEELSSTCFDLAEETSLDAATRRRLYLRAMEVGEPYLQRHPSVFSVLVERSKAASGLASLARSAHNPAEQQRWADEAVKGFHAVLAAHPDNPAVRRMLQSVQVAPH